jgi:hypothetical protein
MDANEIWTLTGICVVTVAVLVIVGRRLAHQYRWGQETRRLQRRFSSRLTKRS